MSTLITDDGHVHPPLNITAPAPFIDLRGFQWRAVDDKIHGPRPDPEGQEQASVQGEFAPAAAEHSAQHEAAAPAAAPAPQSAPSAAPPTPSPLLSGPQAAPVAPALAPQLPLSAGALATSLPRQLGQVPGLPSNDPLPFPLTLFQGSYAGSGLNTIFRPFAKNDTTFFPNQPLTGPTDNILEINLTTEQLTFGPTLGKIPNRGFTGNGQSDLTLQGLPYFQTVQDVTNIESGKGDSPVVDGIHFEPGMWLFVPSSDNPKNAPSVVRMASIPHGTTINAQGRFPPPNVTTQTPLGGTLGGPRFSDFELNTTPFQIGDFTARVVDTFKSMNADKGANLNTPRIPQNLDKFIDQGTISTAIIKNPNIILQNAIKDQNITETITFEVTTGPTASTGPTIVPVPPGPPAANSIPPNVLNGGGCANISFLAGAQLPFTAASRPPPGTGPGTSPPAPTAQNAHADFMTSRFWIESVLYQVNIPALLTRPPGILLMKPTMTNNTAPTPQFAITLPIGWTFPSAKTNISVPGIQLQYSQTVNLNFAGLTWPHVSVATLVPVDPQPFTAPVPAKS